MRTAREAARLLAQALLRGPFEEEALVHRAAELTTPPRRWVRPCMRRLFQAWSAAHRPTPRWVQTFLLRDPRFLQRWSTLHAPPLGATPSEMAPAPGAPSTWRIPALTTPAQLAAWLDVSFDALSARADCRGREARTLDGPMRNYRYTWKGKRSGDARLIESPKPQLRELQRRVLHHILNAIPPHEAAHGFRLGRSVVTFTAPHVRKRVVVRLDLKDFFPSVSGARIWALFYAAGYPDAVARQLAGLCWNAAPDDIWRDFPGTLPAALSQLALARRYRDAHLPQGAPTSPALANLVAFRLDARLTGLANSASASYTRYADDLLFSGDDAFGRTADRFIGQVAAIVNDEGFRVHARKTRIMRQGVRQMAAGVVLNERPNIPRRDYEMLKAMLHRAWRAGPQPLPGQSMTTYRAHLAGKIAWAAQLNPRRGEKLQYIFEQIAWPAPPGESQHDITGA